MIAYALLIFLALLFLRITEDILDVAINAGMNKYLVIILFLLFYSIIISVMLVALDNEFEWR
ncbi:hypothetical protein EVU91_01335 [Macrococcoides bohemicum]|uniref:hypothetical protein n=1 Tax=Macrococcoides bohemicum TaxID=1903056 RepID=UPI001059676A|nr:hypothetical protein [Macrococcus bohemicus]TDL40561.1 hypothetical protein EVU91_01335 [Macrococcus bohemicus]